jgi:hypothetical protein
VTAVVSWQLAVGSWQFAVGSWQLTGLRYLPPARSKVSACSWFCLVHHSASPPPTSRTDSWLAGASAERAITDYTAELCISPSSEAGLNRPPTSLRRTSYQLRIPHHALGTAAEGVRGTRRRRIYAYPAAAGLNPLSDFSSVSPSQLSSHSPTPPGTALATLVDPRRPPPPPGSASPERQSSRPPTISVSFCETGPGDATYGPLACSFVMRADTGRAGVEPPSDRPFARHMLSDASRAECARCLVMLLLMMMVCFTLCVTPLGCIVHLCEAHMTTRPR